MTEKSPNISEVDVTNGNDLNGFGRLLIWLLHENGRIQMYGTPSARQKKLIPIIEQWLVMVRNNVGMLGAEHRTILMDRYDMLYRYVCSSTPDLSFINQQRYSVVDAIINGDKRIDIAQAIWMITFALRQSEKFDFLDRAKNLHDTVLKSWVDDFTASDNFFDIPSDEAVKRALTFLREDIVPFTDCSDTIRKAAAARISLLFNDLNNKDSKTLESMLVYLTFAEGEYIEADIAKAQIADILGLLSVMPQVNRFDRLAYANDLKIRKEN